MSTYHALSKLFESGGDQAIYARLCTSLSECPMDMEEEISEALLVYFSARDKGPSAAYTNAVKELFALLLTPLLVSMQIDPEYRDLASLPPGPIPETQEEIAVNRADTAIKEEKESW